MVAKRIRYLIPYRLNGETKKIVKVGVNISTAPPHDRVVEAGGGIEQQLYRILLPRIPLYWGVMIVWIKASGASTWEIIYQPS